MKKMMIAAFLAFMALNVSANSDDRAVSKGNTSTEVAAAENAKTDARLTEEEITTMKNRLTEIKAMDRSEMTADQKRELKKEVQAIRDKIKSQHDVVIISGGTLLLIILILILI